MMVVALHVVTRGNHLRSVMTGRVTHSIRPPERRFLDFRDSWVMKNDLRGSFHARNFAPFGSYRGAKLAFALTRLPTTSIS